MNCVSLSIIKWKWNFKDSTYILDLPIISAFWDEQKDCKFEPSLGNTWQWISETLSQNEKIKGASSKAVR